MKLNKFFTGQYCKCGGEIWSNHYSYSCKLCKKNKIISPKTTFHIMLVMLLLLSGCFTAKDCVDVCLKQDMVVESYKDNVCTCAGLEEDYWNNPPTCTDNFEVCCKEASHGMYPSGREPDALFIDCKGKCGAGYNMPPPKERLIAYRKDGELVLGVEDASNIEKEKEEG